MSKQFWIVLGVIAAVFIGVVIFNGKANNSTSNVSPTSHVFGSTSSGVKLIEYGDYQCPACGAFYPTVKKVTDKYQDRIQFQFRNLPLTSLHPNAFSAARAAEAAGLQNKYFEMHDLLYQNQTTWASSSSPLELFKSYAKSLGLDMNKFTDDYSSKAVNDKINADIDAFDKTKAEKATPTFFLDGKVLKSADLLGPDGQPSLDKFSQKIDAAIAAKGKQTQSNQTKSEDSQSESTSD